MSSYRFCRTDDIGLLVEALNRCWLPYFPDEGPTTAASFKRSIRDLQVWCSSCMVAFSDADPIGVLIGAKRPWGTLVQKLAVHPDHRRQGHGRHLLTSLASKLAILGPPRIVAEVPEHLEPARALFRACEYVEEAVLTDYELPFSPPATLEGDGSGRGDIVIPVTVDDLVANGLLDDSQRQVCWERSVETLAARKDQIAGLAVVSEEQIQAYVLHIKDDDSRTPDVEPAEGRGSETAVVALRSIVENDGGRFAQLLSPLWARRRARMRLSKVHPSEIPSGSLQDLGFVSAGAHVRYGATAHS